MSRSQRAIDYTTVVGPQHAVGTGQERSAQIAQGGSQALLGSLGEHRKPRCNLESLETGGRQAA